MHNDKDHQVLFVGGPDTHITNPPTCTAHSFSQPSKSSTLRCFSVGQTTSQNCTFTWGNLHRHPIPGPTWLSIPNCISISSAIFFAQITAGSPYTLELSATFLPQNCAFAWGTWSPSNTLFLWPTWIHVQNDILISLAVFVGLTIVTDRPTDTAHYSVCSSGLQDPINLFTALFPGPPAWAGARRELLDFMVQGKINRGRHTDHPAGCHSIWTNQWPPAPSPIFMSRMPFLPPNQQCQSTEGT